MRFYVNSSSNHQTLDAFRTGDVLSGSCVDSKVELEPYDLGIIVEVFGHTMRYYDIHAHLADLRILPQVDNILTESRKQGVCGILVNAARQSEWQQILDLCDNSLVYGALGVHPLFLDQTAAELSESLQQALQAHEHICAIGEIGLDFYHGRQDRDLQIEAFTAQLQLAHDMDLPAILHNRKSWAEFFAVLRNLDSPEIRGVCHHFCGSREIARQALDKGLYLSFCGPLTYTNARRLKDAARYAPLDRILTETDTPDLPCARFHGGQSYPYHVREIVRELSTL